MEKLIHDVKAYIFKHGRALERALFAYHFEQGSKDDVIVQLEKFQNADGGFGHGLEPDFQTPKSSPIATWTAINILRSIAPVRDPMIEKMMKYLHTCHDQKQGVYAFSVPTINDYPHAPWWHYDAQSAYQGYNPTASIIGFMLTNTPMHDSHYINILKRLDKAIYYFMEHEVTEMHELRCFIELYHDLDGKILPTAFVDKLKTMILKTVHKDSKDWFTTYTVKPSALILHPNTPGADDIKELIDEEHRLLLKQTNAHGVWSITWDWSSSHKVGFEKAKKAWEGIIALDVILRLKAFNFREVA